MRPSSLATVALLLVTGIWGSTFFVIKDAVSLMSPIDFLAARFAIGAAVPAVVFLPRLLRLSGRHWLAGLGIGSLFGRVRSRRPSACRPQPPPCPASSRASTWC
ncbi:hypothetical protein [Tessaracoccus coleopterorum]|uniref:hypothetical protein n=1 Tax=Tessaracoccus coleopterorum TaxID=2714950 RepID=UPI002F910A9B